MGKMNREDLFREIGEIDETYVEEARRVQRRRRAPSWVGKTLAAAASLVLCVGIGYITVLVTMPRGSVDGSMSGASDANGSAMEAAQEQRSVAEDKEGQIAGGAGPEEAGEDQAVSKTVQTDSEQPSQENAPVEAPSASEPAPRYDEQADSSRTEGSKEQSESEQIKESLEDKDAIKDMDDSIKEELLQSGESAMDLTWEAARTDAVYGRYVDVQAPEGYSFSSAVRSSSVLYVTWNKGMEEITYVCRQADEDVSDWLVDVEKPEEYDLGLYTFPWSGSVPQELQQQVSNAVFRPDQVTLDIVAARTYQVQEAGDVSGSRTRMGILYGDNVLVEISGKGPSAEEIFAMINLENQV